MGILKIWDGAEWVEITAITGEHSDLTGVADDDYTVYF